MDIKQIKRIIDLMKANELCEFDPAADGNYYVMIMAYNAYSGLTLEVDAASN